MGVRGLATFIKENKSEFLMERKLKKSKVVIDGPNLANFLYKKSELSDQYGGDYDRYAYVINHFFEMLVKCNVEAYVVFDGGEPEVKHDTCLERAQKRIKTVGSLLSYDRDMVLPLLAYDVFLHVMRERGVHVAVADLEADAEIAVIAQALGNAAVISNDSDFYAFNLPGGFIPIDYIQWELHTPDTQSKKVFSRDVLYTGDATPFLRVQWYHVSHLSCYINMSLAPVLAAVIGNDYIEKAISQKLYEEIFKPDTKPKSDGEREYRVQMIMSWLSDFPQHPQEAFDRVLALLSESLRQECEESLKLIFNYYSRPSGSLPHYFGITSPSSTTLGDLVSTGRSSTDDKNDKDGKGDKDDKDVAKKLREEMVKQLRRADLPAKTVDVILYKKVLLKCQVENLFKPSSFDCAKPLRQLVYGCLLDDTSVEEVTRSSKVTDSVAGSRKATSITSQVEASNLPTQDVPVEQLKTACSSNPLPPGSPWLKRGARLLHLSLVHWIKQTQPSTQLTQAVLVCLIKLSIIDPVNRVFKHNTTTDVYEGVIQYTGALESPATLSKEQRCLRERIINVTDDSVKLYSPVFGDVTVSKADVRHATDRLQNTQYSPEEKFEFGRVHSLSEWQACLKAVCWLSAVLDTSLRAPNPARVLNASFVYCLSRHLSTEPELPFLPGKGLSLLFTQLWEGLDITDAQTSGDRTVVPKMSQAKPAKQRVVSGQEQSRRMDRSWREK